MDNDAGTITDPKEDPENDEFWNLDDDDPVIEKTNLDLLLATEPVIEELEFTDKQQRTLNPSPGPGKRFKIPGFPLDHKVTCGACGITRTLGFRQRNCPHCYALLIAPEDAKEVE